MRILCSLLALGLFCVASTGAEIRELPYEGFTIWLDCERRGAVKFRYIAQRDHGAFPRLSRFSHDPDVPAYCQQTSTAPYKHPAHKYDRGHLVPANHFDHSSVAIKQSNYMTNILPQAAAMNRGAWLRTEEIVECYRDIDELTVYGGVFWGSDVTDDHFVTSHGVVTPAAFWKLIIRGQGPVIAWIIPNRAEATRKRLDLYLVTVAQLEAWSGERFADVPAAVKYDRPATSWPVPSGCDKS